jgi:hypothetical protein
VDVSAQSCNACHGVPPAAPHVQNSTCASCHAGYTATTANATTHQNGVVNVTLSAQSCTVCHGAPPPAPHTTSTTCGSCHTGYTATTANATTHRNGVVDVSQSCTSCHAIPPATGRHSKHVSSERIACGTCHTGFTTTTAGATHLNGVKDVASSTGWNTSTRSCSNSCHGTERW